MEERLEKVISYYENEIYQLRKDAHNHKINDPDVLKAFGEQITKDQHLLEVLRFIQTGEKKAWMIF